MAASGSSWEGKQRDENQYFNQLFSPPNFSIESMQATKKVFPKWNLF